MEKKRINSILVCVSIVLILAFLGCLVYSRYNSKFNFIETISALSSFFVAVLTIIYVYTTSKQMDIMQQQLEQMKEDRLFSEQPILDLANLEFKVERPRFFYTPPTDEYSFQARYFLLLNVKNISSFSAVYVDVSAELHCTVNKQEKTLKATSRRINVIASNSDSDVIGIMFPTDTDCDILAALRGYSVKELPKINVSIIYKSLSGANYKSEHTFYLDISRQDGDTEVILQNWHTTLVSAPVDEKRLIDVLKRAPDRATKDKLFEATKKAFDEKLMGEESLNIDIIEIPDKFSMNTITEKEFNDEVNTHSYGRYVGNHGRRCKSHIMSTEVSEV